MKKSARIIAVIMMCVYLIPSITLHVQATEDTPITGELGSVIVDYTYNDDPLDDVVFKVYHVATKNDNYEYEMAEGFEDFEIDFDSLAYDAYWITTRNNLENHIAINTIEPVDEFVTDEFGKYKLEDLEAGLYIIDAANVVKDTDAYFSDPILIMVGYYFGTEEMWMYHYEVQPKSDVLAYTDDQELTITKVWENVVEGQDIPDEVEVSLYCDGQVYETVSLNSENNWTYTWYNIDQLATWGIQEVTELEDFDVEYNKTYFDFTVTNIYVGPEVEVLAAATESTDSTDGTLPQTGTQAKMIPIYAGIGLALIATGVFVDKKGKKNEE